MSAVFVCILACDVPGCVRTFNAGEPRATATRSAAARDEWRACNVRAVPPHTFARSLDLCPAHAALTRAQLGRLLDSPRGAAEVPARKGVVVTIDGWRMYSSGSATNILLRPATVTGASGPHVMLRLQGEARAHPYHPTDERITWPARPPRLDGRGKAIDPDGQYYLQDARTFVGNSVSWWRPDGAGYTCDIDDAGVYSGTEANGHRETDVPWPVAAVLRHAVRHVDWQRLRREMDTPLKEAGRG